MIQNNILELNKIVYLVFIHTSKYLEQKKQNKIIVIWIQQKDLVLEEKMVKIVEYGLIKI